MKKIFKCKVIFSDAAHGGQKTATTFSFDDCDTEEEARAAAEMYATRLYGHPGRTIAKIIVTPA